MHQRSVFPPQRGSVVLVESGGWAGAPLRPLSSPSFAHIHTSAVGGYSKSKCTLSEVVSLRREPQLNDPVATAQPSMFCVVVSQAVGSTTWLLETSMHISEVFLPTFFAGLQPCLAAAQSRFTALHHAIVVCPCMLQGLSFPNNGCYISFAGQARKQAREWKPKQASNGWLPPPTNRFCDSRE